MFLTDQCSQWMGEFSPEFFDAMAGSVKNVPGNLQVSWFDIFPAHCGM